MENSIVSVTTQQSIKLSVTRMSLHIQLYSKLKVCTSMLRNDDIGIPSVKLFRTHTWTK